MQWRIDNFQIAIFGQRDRVHCLVIGLIDFFTDIFQQPFVSGFIDGKSFYLRDIFRYLVHQSLVIRRDQLPAESIIHFFTVISRQIVTGTEHVAGDSIEMPNRKGKLRRGPDGLKHINLEVICRIHGCRCFG